MTIKQLHQKLFGNSSISYLVPINMAYNYYKDLERKYNQQMNPFRCLTSKDILKADKKPKIDYSLSIINFLSAFTFNKLIGYVTEGQKPGCIILIGCMLLSDKII
jgi:hypothetical protein